MLSIARAMRLFTAWGLISVAPGPASAAQAASWRFDCGAEDSPVARGYRPLTPRHRYSKESGFGWEKGKPSGRVVRDLPDLKRFVLYPYMMENLNDLNRDSIISEEDLTFRVDVPKGRYRVTVMLGDMSQALGSIDVAVNGQAAADHVSAWTPGTRGPGNHRRLLMDPYGWWTRVRHTVTAHDGYIRIELKKNQSYYDRMLASQENHEEQWDKDWRRHYQRVGVASPPYFFIGWPFVRHSVMAIEVVPHRPAPVVGRNDRLELARPVQSPGLTEAIEAFNRGDYNRAHQALQRAKEPEARVARSIVLLWLAGRLEVEREKGLVSEALATLREYVKARPSENSVAEIESDAEIFERALRLHLTRGDVGKNHFLENIKAIGWWWLISEESPLYYKSQLYIARAAHMLIPYFPTRGTEREIFRKLEKRFPGNRYVKYHLNYAWEPHGDGSRFEDWHMTDYGAKVKDSPEWVRELYPAFAGLVDLSEWWFKYRMGSEGALGGGWGDDVEILPVFAYMGYASRDVSSILLPGLRKFMDGLWQFSEVDPDLGFCLPLSDAEHVAEWTGNTLGMMVQIDYGNPQWIERSMKTAKLMRDYWTAPNNNGHRHFRANYFGATQVGSGEQMNDSWINYRAIRPAAAVRWYNQNPAVSRLYVELADAWGAAAMATERGKPKGVIPAEISFPDGIIGGTNSPNWYTASHGPETGNEDWVNGSEAYKGYVYDLFFNAHGQTGDPKYFEPMRLEYELAARYNNVSALRTGARLQSTPSDAGRDAGMAAAKPGKPDSPSEVGSERWVGENLKGASEWLVARRMVEGRKGKLEDDLSKDDIIRKARWASKELRERWPLMTTEAGPTDRVAFAGCVNPFLIYTGGRIGGPSLEAAVTYGNTTKDFAAAVLATDAQGFRLLYHSLASGAREIEIYPWHLEPAGKYILRYGPDSNEDAVMDLRTEERKFDFPQVGTPFRIRVDSRTTYVVEVEQIERGQRTRLVADPGLSSDDIRYDERWGLLLARIHNVGSERVRDLEVVAFDGDPKAGGMRIGMQSIPNIEAPNDLEPRTVTVGFSWRPTKKIHEIYILVDPEDKIKDEITTLNNVVSRRLELDPSRLIFEFRGGTE